MIFEKEGHLPHYRMMMGEAFKGEVGSVGEVVIQEYAKAEVDYSAGRW
jgi:hypothetical protein